jgi:hypothetical protein
MNSKTLAITAVLAAALLTGIFTMSTMAVYAERDYDKYDGDEHDMDEHDGEEREHDEEDYRGDGDKYRGDGDKYRGGGDESETNTEQSIKQKNVGSGESTNNNCAQNVIDTLAAATVACPVTAVQ